MRYRDRFIRVYPGWIRTEVHGLQENKQMAERLTLHLLEIPGVHHVQACTITGRVRIQFDPQQTNAKQVCESIYDVEKMQDEWIKSSQEAAVTEEETVTKEEKEVEVQDVSLEVPEEFQQVLDRPSPSSIPLGLAVTAGGLTFLGAKQLIYGKSALARHPALFAMSGIVSVITGYPFLRRGFRQLSQNRRFNSDLILGTAAIGLGLMRENLLVLAGLSILQYIQWKRDQLEQADGFVNELEERYLSPAIRKYSEKIGKWAFPLAGVAWAVTRDPLCGLAVLLAANPRPTIVPAIAAWKQAETEVLQKGGWIPKNGSLAQLARTKTLLVEDTAQLFKPSYRDLQLLTNEEDPEQIWTVAASLLEKTKHPWKDYIYARAKQSKRTIRTAFSVKPESGGISGEINHVSYYFGNLAYLQKHRLSVDPYLLKLKRMQKNRTEAYCLVKKNGNQTECLGVIFQENNPPIRSFLSLRKKLKDCGWNIAILNNSLDMETEVLESYSIDTSWLYINDEGKEKWIAQLRERGEEVLLLTQDGNGSAIPVVRTDQLKQLPDYIQLSHEIDQRVHQQFKMTKLFNGTALALAIPFRVSAMMINLLADALSLVFLSRLKETKIPTPWLNQAALETAAAVQEKAECPCWHALSPQEVVTYFSVDEQAGLDEQKIQYLRQTFGWNQLDQKETSRWWKTYLKQFKEFTTLLLLSTTLLSFFTGDVFNGIAIGTILLANAAVGAIQEQKAEKVVEALNRYQAPMCRVIRNGKEQIINGKELVPGDLVCLEAGDRVPADIRLLQSYQLEVDESMLTGESLPVVKLSEPVTEDSPLAERNNMVFKGTCVSRGKGIGIVVATGMRTEMGKMLALMEGDSNESTPLQKEVTHISKIFVKGALAVAIAILGIGLIRGHTFSSMIATSITLAASAIPEGLPVTVTIALSAGIFRMAKKGALIRKLSALETLGRVSVICTDKTGTLTQNEMTVLAAATINKQWRVTGQGYSPNGSLISDEKESQGQKQDLEQLVKIASLCNNATLLEEEGKWKVQGDPTEGALLAFIQKTGLATHDQEKWKRVHEIPFDSAKGQMSVVCQEGESNCYLLTKGSVESILSVCRFVQMDGQVIPMTEEHQKHILKLNEKWAKKAMRVLAFAYRPVEWNGDCTEIEQQSIFVGMVGMMDPPKPDVKESIQEAHRLGVRVVMITGDHPITAGAIAEEVGIGQQPVIMTGQELDQLSDEELSTRIDQVSVFARVTPEHKLRIVRAYQRCKHIVAMTGDGVNDTPAVKQADIGIAMGQTGTEVTKEAADMVLQYDHFSSIVEGVKEGRTIISNIRKAVGCLLTGNLAEIIVTGTAVIAGMPVPLIPIHVLLMNLITDAVPAMVLAMNPGNKTKQTRLKKIADRELFTKVGIRGAMLGLGSLGLFVASRIGGASLPVAQTTAFATLVCGQLMQVFSWRQEGSDEKLKDWAKDRLLVGAMGISLLALLGAIYIPGLSSFFRTAPLGFNHWLQVFLVSGLATMGSKPIQWLVHSKEKQPHLHEAEVNAFAA
ncbi:ATPase, P-type (transporting), HAD superfamily, subfamily IC [Thermoflavimicrobium dichotomicum]|uniref:P-type Ca(2+) transporter n=1 Tax=Thermoflavimicrobium dichotomicum TaxID=46223 RepID=A0A1I3NAD4_9BACL|nr:ATPase, P-type (transporting), HAD superfamily, subfamily IC [Thermoflavimicrobium dichotomicum]